MGPSNQDHRLAFRTVIHLPSVSSYTLNTSNIISRTQQRVDAVISKHTQHCLSVDHECHHEFLQCSMAFNHHDELLIFLSNGVL